MTSTTLQDYGRRSLQYGNIPYFYVFQYRFYVANHYVTPEEISQWCRDSCMGYYKIVTYTHSSSIRNLLNPTKFEERITFVDKIYLAHDIDATTLKLAYPISEIIIRRPEKMPALKKD